MSNPVARAGSLLQVDTGKYSNYSIIGFFVVLRDFEPARELAEFLDAHPEQRHDVLFEDDEFLAAMLAKGLLLEIQCGILHLSEYHDHRQFKFTPVFSTGDE